jgi:hypothetical protein
MNPDHVALGQASVPFLAVAICRTRHGNLHTGAVYRDAAGDLRLFHQAWHHNTRDGPVASEVAQLGGPLCCVVPAVEPVRARAIAGFWEFVASRRESLGYALQEDPEAVFDANTGLLIMPNGIGLSCSTFVLALFRGARFPLIDTTDWPASRPGDREAQQHLVDLLEQTCQDKAHVEVVRAQIGCERVRPEEVAGAALYPGPAARHQAAEDGGLFIRGALCVLDRPTDFAQAPG